MASFLVYWKTFWEDDPDTDHRFREPDWRSDRVSFMRAAATGSELWVVAHGGEAARGEWRLLERFGVPPQKPQSIVTRHGHWRIVGDPSDVEVFETAGQPDFARILRQLEFRTHNPIKATGRRIGQAIQTPRPLSVADLAIMRAAASKLAPRRRRRAL